MSKLVSIIVPVYNVAEYVGNCLQSLCDQSYEDIEIIVIDDGSSDDSLSICRKWEQKDNRIKVIAQENQGVSVARNAGLGLCKGEYTVFVDGDDFLERDAIEVMFRHFDPSVDIVMTDFLIDNGNTCSPDQFFKTDMTFVTHEEKVELIKNCFVRTSIAKKDNHIIVGVPWAKMYRTAIIKDNDITFDSELRKMQDAIFNLEVFHQAGKIVYLHDCYPYHYVQNRSSVTHKGNPQYEEITGKLLKALHNRIEEYGLKELEGVYEAKRFISAFECIKFIYILDEGKYTYRQKITGVKRLMDKLVITKEQEEALMPYLGRMYRIAFRLYRMKMYDLLYILSAAFLKYKEIKK